MLTAPRQRPRVAAVIVTYRPDVAALARLCRSVAPDATVVVVDNTEAPGIAGADVAGATEVVALGANTGIAHAQNVGIERALALEAGVIVLFDQDSTVPAGFVTTLASGLDPAAPAVVAPRYVDAAHGFELPSGRLGRFGWPRPVTSGGTLEPYRVDVVMASGTAATRAAYATVGLLDEALFIDHVDSEWCLRCRARGVPIEVVPAAVMEHRIGTASRRVAGVHVLIHSPARCYYQIRNSLLLFRRAHIPFLFALRETVGIVLSRMLLLLFVANRSAYVGAYLAAIKDGLKGVGGKRAE
jgi:rhamnosyltransferase